MKRATRLPSVDALLTRLDNALGADALGQSEAAELVLLAANGAPRRADRTTAARRELRRRLDTIRERGIDLYGDTYAGDAER